MEVLPKLKEAQDAILPHTLSPFLARPFAFSVLVLLLVGKVQLPAGGGARETVQVRFRAVTVGLSEVLPSWPSKACQEESGLREAQRRGSTSPRPARNTSLLREGGH